MKNEEKIESEFQIIADELAHTLLLERELFSLISVFQSHCDFNLSWLFQASPLIVKKESLEFLVEHKDKFKRKINIQEIINYDWIISVNNLESFEEFKTILSNK